MYIEIYWDHWDWPSEMTIEPDVQWPKMWRVRYTNGTVSDMVNRTRAKDAAESAVLSMYNQARSGVAA